MRFLGLGFALALGACVSGQIIALDLAHGPPLVKLSVNAGAPVDAIIDTGADMSVLTIDYARTAYLPEQGSDYTVSPLGGDRLEGFRTTVSNATLNGVSVPAFPASAVPIDLGDAQAIVSPSAFAGQLVTFDFAGSRMIVSPRRAQSGVRSAYGADGLPTIPVTIGGRSFAAHLDTGSDSPLSMGLSQAAGLRLRAAPVKVGEGQSVAATFDIYSATLDGDMTVGPLVLHNPAIEFLDVPSANVNVGRDTLRAMEVTLDPERKLVWTRAR